jgi:hypothetical protein
MTFSNLKVVPGRSGNEKAEQNNPAVYIYKDIYFLNLLRPRAARPTKPEPSSISVAGSGTGETSLPFVSDTVSGGVTDFEEKFDLLSVVAELSEGQPVIEKNIITTHNNINNFFIFILWY